MNIVNILKLINQGQTIGDKLNIIKYLKTGKSNKLIKMCGPNNTIFLGVPNFEYTIWHNFINYDKKIFEKISQMDFDTFIDIGANLGKYSIILNKINPTLKVLAFEPIQQNLDVFKENCIENKINPIIKQVALSDSIGKTSLFLSEQGKEGSHSIVRNHGQGNISIFTDILDNYREFFSKNTLIKIDVEGAEMKVLKGGIKCIKLFKPIILFESETEPKEIISLLSPFGYDIQKIDGINYIARVI